MALTTDEILDILRERGIEPTEEIEGADLPDVGQIREGETVYSTSMAEVFGEPDDESSESVSGLDDDRLNEWWSEIERMIGPEEGLDMKPRPALEPPEPHCA